MVYLLHHARNVPQLVAAETGSLTASGGALDLTRTVVATELAACSVLASGTDVVAASRAVIACCQWLMDEDECKYSCIAVKHGG